MGELNNLFWKMPGLFFLEGHIYIHNQNFLSFAIKRVVCRISRFFSNMMPWTADQVVCGWLQNIMENTFQQNFFVKNHTLPVKEYRC